jgi:hypothetical protein
MTTEQKNAIVEGQQTESPVVLIEVDSNQMAVAAELSLSLDDLTDMAGRAFNSVLKGKIQSAINSTIKAKYIAEAKGRKVLAEECEKEIQAAMKLMRSIS